VQAQCITALRELEAEHTAKLDEARDEHAEALEELNAKQYAAAMQVPCAHVRTCVCVVCMRACVRVCVCACVCCV
jgi:hypothetical protein